jgi:hypothetical protein
VGLGANWTVTSTFSGGQPVTQAKEPAMLGSRTREARRGLTASILVVGLAFPVTVASASNAQAAAAPAAAVAAAPTVTRLADTELDPRALYFVSYDGLVNNASYQQDGILTYGGYQYAAWYTASRRAVIARRQLPSGAWQTLQLPHSLTINDSHNSI